MRLRQKPKLNFFIAKATALQFSETDGPHFGILYGKAPREIGLATSMVLHGANVCFWGQNTVLRPLLILSGHQWDSGADFIALRSMHHQYHQ